MKASDRAHVRLMPRVKHIHNYNTIVSLKGRTVRYGCHVCPAVDWFRYRLTDPVNDILKGYAPASVAVQAQAFRKSVAQAVQTASKPLKTSGWLSGSEGDRTDPHGPNAGVVLLPMETTSEEIDAARNTLRKIVQPDEATERDMYLDPDHPHADILEPPAEVFYSEAQLIDMSKDEVYTVAASLNIAGRSTMKKAGLITAILGVQENNFKSADSLR